MRNYAEKFYTWWGFKWHYLRKQSEFCAVEFFLLTVPSTVCQIPNWVEILLPNTTLEKMCHLAISNPGRSNLPGEFERVEIISKEVATKFFKYHKNLLIVRFKIVTYVFD